MTVRMMRLPLCATIIVCLLFLHGGTNASFVRSVVSQRRGGTPGRVLGTEGQPRRVCHSWLPKKQFSIHSRNHPPTATALHALPSPTTVQTQMALFVVGHVVGGALAVPLVAGATRTWYRKIPLPSWTPPDRVFGPVWTALYAAMGVAVARVVQRQAVWKSTAVVLWMVHYALNLTWAPVFFGLKRLRLGLWINYLLVGTLVAGVLPLFAESNQLSALLLVPYAAWLIYATILNQAICRLNPVLDARGYNEAKFQADLIQLQEEAATYAGI